MTDHTKLPWSASKHGYVSARYENVIVARCGDFENKTKDLVMICGPRWQADAEYIARSANLYPALIDALSAAEHESLGWLDKVNAVLKEVRKS